MIALFADKLIISTENNSLACRWLSRPQPNRYPRAIQTSETTPCVVLRSDGKARYASYSQLFGFTDRGLIKPGMKADLNVIDYDKLRLTDLELAHDLPAGGARFLQGASGYIATLVNGVVTRRYDEDTQARPGRLLRS